MPPPTDAAADIAGGFRDALNGYVRMSTVQSLDQHVLSGEQINDILNGTASAVDVKHNAHSLPGGHLYQRFAARLRECFPAVGTGDAYTAPSASAWSLRLGCHGTQKQNVPPILCQVSPPPRTPPPRSPPPRSCIIPALRPPPSPPVASITCSRSRESPD